MDLHNIVNTHILIIITFNDYNNYCNIILFAVFNMYNFAVCITIFYIDDYYNMCINNIMQIHLLCGPKKYGIFSQNY